LAYTEASITVLSDVGLRVVSLKLKVEIALPPLAAPPTPPLKGPTPKEPAVPPSAS
jgi:hypothetical protein